MLHTIKTKQLINSDIATVWEFISTPSNLALITPDFMRFEILNDKRDIGKMYPGQTIEYKVSPLKGIRMNWVTEITHVLENEYFVDEQRMGPYSFWHHKHFLKEVGYAVEMTDIVHYRVPLGPLGVLLNTIFIKNRLKVIFDYRFNKIKEIFNRKIKT